MYYIPEEEVIFIPYNVPSSKNSRGISAQGYSFPSKATQKWKKLTKNFDWEEVGKIFNASISILKPPVLIGFHFVRNSRRKYDWINPMQTIMDEMTRRKWIIDDSVEYVFPFPLKIRGVFTSYDKEYPGVYIKILNQTNYDL